ncbi:hypothetical protein DRN75_00840 [Nanoarchaeota archaeon]|nr:MAG: hypothetical protein DRN75_00840 [Nanoarchaeota archaeon]
MAGRNRNTTGSGTVIESRIAGIPCQIEITEYKVCPAEPDVGIFYPYEEIEYLVRDRKGYLAPWLERKITDEDIEQQIIDYMQP